MIKILFDVLVALLPLVGGGRCVVRSGIGGEKFSGW
jgi:hypothetical protein